MENTLDKLVNYKHHFSSNGDYKYFDDFSPELRNKSSSFFLKIFTKINEDYSSIEYLKVLNENYCFGTSFNPHTLDLSSKFMIDISFKYVRDLNEKYVATNISTLKSKHENIIIILNILTDILYTNDKIHREIDSVWMLFLHNLNPFIGELFNIENSKIAFWESRLEIEKNDNPYPNYTTSDWGWIDFHITSFIKGFFNVLEEILTISEQVAYKQMSYDDKEKFHNYLKNVSKNLKRYFSFISIQEIEEIKPLEDFIRDRYFKIIEKTELYEQHQRENKIIISNYVPVVSNLEATSITFEKHRTESDMISPIDELLYNDFIDMMVGKDRKSKEVKFDKLMKKMPKGSVLINDGKYKWNSDFFIETYKVAQNKPQNYIYAFFIICLDEGYISLEELSPIKSIREVQIKDRISITFQEKDISHRRFRDYEIIQMKKDKIHYFKPFEGLISSEKVKKS